MTRSYDRLTVHSIDGLKSGAYRPLMESFSIRLLLAHLVDPTRRNVRSPLEADLESIPNEIIAG